MANEAENIYSIHAQSLIEIEDINIKVVLAIRLDHPEIIYESYFQQTRSQNKIVRSKKQSAPRACAQTH